MKQITHPTGIFSYDSMYRQESFTLLLLINHTNQSNESFFNLGKYKLLHLNQLQWGTISIYKRGFNLSMHTTNNISGVALTRKKLLFLRKKKSRLRKSENTVRLLYAKNSDLTHQNEFSLFVFCTQQRFVEHLPWV